MAPRPRSTARPRLHKPPARRPRPRPQPPPPPAAAKDIPHAGRSLLQSPGAFGDDNAYNSFYGDPWGTANGYYDPYGPGYIPGFINVDISKQYGTHLDFGPAAVDITNDYAGFAIGGAVGAGWARDGRG